MDDVFKALADTTRRSLLDQLFDRNGQTLSALSAVTPMSRQGVSKHLKILEAANLITVRRQGRETLHFINPVPLAQIVHRWIGRFEDARLEGLLDLKSQTENNERHNHGL